MNNKSIESSRLSSINIFASLLHSVITNFHMRIKYARKKSLHQRAFECGTKFTFPNEILYVITGLHGDYLS